MSKRTQKDVIRELLRERGQTGVSAHEATYQLGITRLAAIIHDLKKEGLNIRAKVEKGMQARYVLEPPVRTILSQPLTSSEPVKKDKQAPAAGQVEAFPGMTWEQVGSKFDSDRRGAH